MHLQRAGLSRRAGRRTIALVVCSVPVGLVASDSSTKQAVASTISSIKLIEYHLARIEYEGSSKVS